jgi:hypothetical protein
MRRNVGNDKWVSAAASSPAEMIGNLKSSRTDWHPKGEVITAGTSLVEIDELNPTGRSVNVMASPAAHAMGELILSGAMASDTEQSRASLARVVRDAVQEAGVDIAKLMEELTQSDGMSGA